MIQCQTQSAHVNIVFVIYLYSNWAKRSPFLFSTSKSRQILDYIIIQTLFERIVTVYKGKDKISWRQIVHFQGFVIKIVVKNDKYLLNNTHIFKTI